MGDAKMQIRDYADLRKLGHAIKNAREKQHLPRKKVVELIGISERHLTSIEIDGQHPSVQVLYTLVRMFNIPVDPYFFPEMADGESPLREQIQLKLHQCDEAGLEIVNATLDAVLKSHGKEG
ncbi:helix-turn-helix transcriptional regulator [Anaerotruncus rubiinfantis]|uniref:helix-turn-helix transcriptional regulator n=1 Tax=Anaerotruncus rubiinfantis TaxID=1720200 RepID=UPI00164E69BF|nr:helix-turn-helix transcriptional regulator [Anaerotruncus rubiinfantis]